MGAFDFDFQPQKNAQFGWVFLLLDFISLFENKLCRNLLFSMLPQIFLDTLIIFSVLFIFITNESKLAV